MELRHLRYFVSVADSLHFGQAAAKLQIAQPSLSQQIRQLEAELQTLLLRRTKRRVELTPAGRAFLDEAREILVRADRAALIARRAGAGEDGRLRVGVGYCMDPVIVARAVAGFNRQHAAVRVELQTMAVSLQVTALRNERLDIAFVRPPVADGSLQHEIVIREPLVAALPRSHRLARRGTVPLPALIDEPFILAPRDLVPAYHDIVLRACRQAGFVPRNPHEADHLQMVMGMVAAGTGVALVPEFVQNTRTPGVVFAALRRPAPELETAIAWRRENGSPVLKEFVRVARQVLTRQ